MPLWSHWTRAVTLLCVQDITDIIANCASTHWVDRKEGLVGLQNYFQNGNALTGSELKRVADIFTKMFMDSHTKVSREWSASEFSNIRGSWKRHKYFKIYIDIKVIIHYCQEVHRSVKNLRVSFECNVQSTWVIESHFRSYFLVLECVN